MEKVLQELKNYSRWRELEKLLPQLQEQRAEARERRIEAAGRLEGTKWELNRLEKPGFFQRLRGGLEEKKETFQQEKRIAEADYQRAKEELDRRMETLEAVQKEMEALSGSWERYLDQRQSYLNDGGDEAALQETEAPILIALALQEIEECLDALENARPWMRAEVNSTRVRQGSRKMEFLGLAAEKAHRLRTIVEHLPEGSAEISPYLRSPDHYVTNATMAYKQLDRLDLAVEQVRQLRSDLKLNLYP